MLTAGADGPLEAVLEELLRDRTLKLLVKAFACIILGGVGSTAGVYLGSFLLAAAETVVLTQTNGLWVDAVSFGLIFLVLLVRPSGIFGRKEVRRT